jgi:pyrroline-5-carboxylate reductase
MIMQNNIVFIGGGNITASIVGGLVAAGQSPQSIIVSDPHPEKLERLTQAYGIRTTTDNHKALAEGTIVVLAVKPQKVQALAQDIAPILKKTKPLIISLAGGIDIHTLTRWLGDECAVVRAMPNMPAVVRSGATALFANSHADESQREDAESILRAIGIVVWLKDEKQMDVITALSGCGPAYIFYIMEALSEAAQKMGLPAEVANLLTLETTYGAAHMALESELSLSDLKKSVATPGGITEAALTAFDEHNIKKILAEAVHRAHARSQNLTEIAKKA